MEKLETGVLYIGTKKMEETAEHISRLSIRYSLKGEQYYRIGSTDHVIDPKKYVIVNQGQRYKTAFDTTEDHEMILVAFKPGFAETILHDMVTPDDQLLDRPHGQHDQPIHFYEHTYAAGPQLVQQFQHLKQLMDLKNGRANLADLYEDMMRQLLLTHRHTLEAIRKIPGIVRVSTKAELYRRLCIARDYLDTHTSRNILLEDVAREASLSVHHFKRTFTSVFGISPHRYHVEQRLKKAFELATGRTLTSSDICAATGFENTSSFIRLFRQRYGFTPGTISGLANETINQ